MWAPVMSDDGSVFFMSFGNPTGQNACGDSQLFRLHPDGTYAQLTACGDPEPYYDYLAIRPDGQVVPVTVLKAGPCVVVHRPILPVRRE